MKNVHMEVPGPLLTLHRLSQVTVTLGDNLVHQGTLYLVTDYQLIFQEPGALSDVRIERKSIKGARYWVSAQILEASDLPVLEVTS